MQHIKESKHFQYETRVQGNSTKFKSTVHWLKYNEVVRAKRSGGEAVLWNKLLDISSNSPHWLKASSG